MKGLGFSETQFVFGVISEIVSGNAKNSLIPSINLGTPFFPTLVEEAKRGYDVAFKDVTPFFIQFKVATELTESYGKGAKALISAAKKKGKMLNPPFYRFKLRSTKKSSTNTSQHSILVALSKTSGNIVLYCSPAFVGFDKYVEFYSKKEISNNSVFIDVKNLTKEDDGAAHSIYYQVSPEEIYEALSEPKEIKGLYGWERLCAYIKEQQYENRHKGVSEFISSMCAALEYNGIKTHHSIVEDISGCDYMRENVCFERIMALTNNDFGEAVKLFAVIQALYMQGIITCFMVNPQ